MKVPHWNVSNELLGGMGCGGVGVGRGGAEERRGRGFKLALRDPNPHPQLHVYMCAGMDHFLVLCDHWARSEIFDLYNVTDKVKAS